MEIPRIYSQCVLRSCSSVANGVSSREPVSVLTVVNLSVSLACLPTSPPPEVKWFEVSRTYVRGLSGEENWFVFLPNLTVKQPNFVLVCCSSIKTKQIPDLKKLIEGKCVVNIYAIIPVCFVYTFCIYLSLLVLMITCEMNHILWRYKLYIYIHTL